MSIYPVKFEKFWMEDIKRLGINSIVKKSRCNHCKGKMPSYGFIAYHALAWGYAFGEWWCSWSCCYGERKVKH